MEIEMSYFQSPTYAATTYFVTDLVLDNGAVFTGELSIEPEAYGDWYIYNAISDDEEDEARNVFFSENINTETFEAICRAVYKNSRLCMAICEEARL
jgi:hypothetical protein